MNVLVIGCGKVGSRLAAVLCADGHDVSVVDSNEENFELLDNNYDGFKTCGIPIDKDVLKRAGIENCDALAAVSPDDNVNIMVSELAREIFKVPIVISRIYDPRRKEVFSHFGLYTICPTNLTVDAVRSALANQSIEETQLLNIDSYTINFTTEPVPKSLIGSLANELELSENQSLYAILHEDLTLTLYQGQKIRFLSGDKIVISNVVD